MQEAVMSLTESEGDGPPSGPEAPLAHGILTLKWW